MSLQSAVHPHREPPKAKARLERTWDTRVRVLPDQCRSGCPTPQHGSLFGFLVSERSGLEIPSAAIGRSLFCCSNFLHVENARFRQPVVARYGGRPLSINGGSKPLATSDSRLVKLNAYQS